MSRRRVAPQEGATGRELKAIESENAKTESLLRRLLLASAS